MASLFLDTNVLLDLSSADRPEHAAARKLVGGALRGGHRLVVLASSLKDVYYVYGRHYGSEPEARKVVSAIRSLADVCDLTLGLVDAALADAEPDFEDGLVREAALSSGCGALVTRDAPGFAGMGIPKCTPAEALAMIESGGLG